MVAICGIAHISLVAAQEISSAGAQSVIGLATATFFSACHSVGWSLVSLTLCFFGGPLCSLIFLVFWCSMFTMVFVVFIFLFCLSYLFNFSYHIKKG